MKSTFSVIYYLKRQVVKKDGTVPVMGRITVDGSQTQFSCKLTVDPKLWDTKGGRVTGRSSAALETNRMLDKMRVRIQLLHIYDARGNGFEHAVEMTGRLYTTLALFLKSSTQKETQLTAATYVQKSIEYISANYSYPITVEDIAAYVGLSRSHLFRSFELVLQQSPKEYLTDFRMKQACYLLEHSNLSITAIANSVGFDNGLYFSKTFHKKKGASPKAYRIKIRGTE